MTATCVIITDPALEAPEVPLPQSGWVSRRLYWGEAGAENWLAVVNEPNYPLRDRRKFGLLGNSIAALASHPARTLVSLGSGDGRPDLELLRALGCSSHSAAGALKYIPVDISLPLLKHSITNVQAAAAVPVGICCDFEDGMDFLGRTLEVYAERPVVFALLGGTVGNLDNGDELFFNGMRRLLSDGDALLIDVPLAGPAWNEVEEPRLKAEQYSPTFRRFLAEGAGLADRAKTDQAAAQVQDAFDNWASFRHEQDATTRAEVITISGRKTGHRVLMFRRYHWEPLLRWLEGLGYVIKFARSSIVFEQDRFGMGVVLLTAPNPLERT